MVNKFDEHVFQVISFFKKLDASPSTLLPFLPLFFLFGPSIPSGILVFIEMILAACAAWAKIRKIV